MTRSRFLLLSLLLVGVGVLGCSKGNPAVPARVSGRISYKGQPIKAGSMSFVTVDGMAYAAQISTDGTYAATDLPAGEMVVVVETESVNPARGGAKGKEAAFRKAAVQPGPTNVEVPTDHYIKIPEKYKNPKTSPLTITLNAGRQVHDFDLTD